MSLSVVRVGTIVLWVSLVGCGAGRGLRSSFPDNRPEHVRALLQRLEAGPVRAGLRNQLGQPLAVVALDGDPGGLVALDLGAGRELWRRPMAVDSEPVIGGPVVIIRSGQEVLGLSLRDGRPLWRRSLPSLEFMGAAVEGDRAVLSFSTPGEQSGSFRRAEAWVLNASTGQRLWKLGPMDKQFGAPALHRGVVFLPWDRLSLSAFDVESGEELARLLSRDDVYSFVEAAGDGVYYGSTSAYRLTDQSASGLREESDVYEPLVANAPPAATFHADGYWGQEGGRNARRNIRFLWRGAPMAQGQVQLADNALYFMYYRIVFAFVADSGEVRWVRTLDQDLQAAAVVDGGIVVMGDGGHFWALDAATGAVTAERPADLAVANGTLDVASLPRGQAGGETQGTVRDQLLGVILDPDARLLPVRRFALALLGGVPQEEVTQDLLEICRDRSLPEPLRRDSGIVLRSRQVGTQYLTAALADHYDFLAEREAPPVGVIASALLHVGERSATRLLLSHLTDPETPRDDLAGVAAALRDLGDEAIMGPVGQFLVRYHADSEFSNDAGPLLDLARAVALYGGEAGREILASLQADRHTLPSLAEGVAELLAAQAEEAGSHQDGAQASLPALDTEAVRGVMEGARDRLRPCIQAALRRHADLSEIRFDLVVTEAGELEELTVEPQDDPLGACVALALAEVEFPRGDDRRQGTFSIGIQH
jgi:outer membrane protein assembly factor BamB